MLEPWIIEQIRRREEEERQGHQRPRLEIPARDDRDDERERDSRREKARKEEEPERGVTIIDYGVA
jgi:hypothetical protein